jgi:hypothetical protein
MTRRAGVIKMALRVFSLLTVFYDLNVTIGHELDRGQKNVWIASGNVLIKWQPNKFTNLVGSCFEMYKDCHIVFWLS